MSDFGLEVHFWFMQLPSDHTLWVTALYSCPRTRLWAFFSLHVVSKGRLALAFSLGTGKGHGGLHGRFYGPGWWCHTPLPVPFHQAEPSRGLVPVAHTPTINITSKTLI